MVREMLPLAEIYVYEDDYTGEKEFVREMSKTN